MELIDTHCHLTDKSNSELQEILVRAAKCSVNRVICIGASVGIDSAIKSVELSHQFENLWATVGVHPHDAGSFTDLKEIEHLASDPKVVAIGETGLDFFKDWAPRDKQFTLFKDSIRVALEHQKPLVIHCRDANEETIRVLEDEGASEVGGVFHCYAGNAEMAEAIAKLNFIVSFTGVVTFKRATELRETVAKIPLERIMVETDCPYMAPEPFRGKESEPMHVYQIASKIAEVKGLSLEEVAQVTTDNAERLFGLN